MQTSDALKLIQYEISDTPQLYTQAMAILSKVMGLSNTQILTGNYELDDEATDKLDIILSKIKSGHPIEYVLGGTDFFSHSLEVTNGVLIPRPETEQLVEISLELVRKHNSLNIFEIGVGSGCIITSILKTLKDLPITYTGIDISEQALDTTYKNLGNLGVKMHRDRETITGKLNNAKISISLTSLLENSIDPTISMIIANPPYLTSYEILNLHPSVGNFEPFSALYGGIDGMKFYRSISDIAKKLNKLPLICSEISPSIADKCAKLFGDLYKTFSITEDLFGRKRFLICEG